MFDEEKKDLLEINEMIRSPETNREMERMFLSGSAAHDDDDDNDDKRNLGRIDQCNKRKSFETVVKIDDCFSSLDKDSSLISVCKTHDD